MRAADTAERAVPQRSRLPSLPAATVRSHSPSPRAAAVRVPRADEVSRGFRAGGGSDAGSVGRLQTLITRPALDALLPRMRECG